MDYWNKVRPGQVSELMWFDRQTGTPIDLMGAILVSNIPFPIANKISYTGNKKSLAATT